MSVLRATMHDVLVAFTSMYPQTNSRSSTSANKLGGKRMESHLYRLGKEFARDSLSCRRMQSVLGIAHSGPLGHNWVLRACGADL